MSITNLNIQSARLGERNEILITTPDRGEFEIVPHPEQLSQGNVLVLGEPCTDPVAVEICRQLRSLLDANGDPQPDTPIQLKPNIRVPYREAPTIQIPLAEIVEYAFGIKTAPEK